jgi:hypothetical protein
MKLEDKWIVEGDRTIHKRVFDVEPSLNMVKEMKSQGLGTKQVLSESYLAARIPLFVINEILKKAGVKWNDPASKQVITNALNSPEYSKFRVWEGQF